MRALFLLSFDMFTGKGRRKVNGEVIRESHRKMNRQFFVGALVGSVAVFTFLTWYWENASLTSGGFDVIWVGFGGYLGAVFGGVCFASTLYLAGIVRDYLVLPGGGSKSGGGSKKKRGGSKKKRGGSKKKRGS